ncbi:endoplasmic reticulum junction formation protein lunapark-A-like isoform X2 [Homarus americanus]|uniref:Endoplasmic reticulum junction formation protein lunapark n=1 Tax=Homarus americanus TaxID=6706 RepID=A0A8J5JL39_HOMAM|nr:endoplasmic reticulum junction formation protein lunapark-A-like isoform X2 [Homarus americanus]KAG7157754.1 Endoplasmic reticulum junction formation protein lunapark-like [Homarus americanus]
MGLIISRFRRKKSTKELLEQIQEDVEAIEEYRETTEQKQKRLVGSLVLYSIVIYLAAALIFYFHYFPLTLQDQLLYATPFIVFPFLIYLLKRLLTWYYHRKISKNEEKLKNLREEKEKILEQVMETETYKVAKEILEVYAPDQLRRTQMHKAPVPLPSVAQRIPAPNNQHSDVRRRVVSSSATPQAGPQGAMGVRPVGPQVLPPHHTPAFTPRPPLLSQSTPARPAPGIIRGDGIPPGPPMPRPVLPRERGYLDRFIEYLVGDGPTNRFALVCRQCESHNGMALKDEFQYLAFRCAYCFYWNPARKQRPAAPRLENLSLPPPLPVTEDQEEDDEEEDEEEEEQEEQESSSSEEEEEEDEEEGGVEEEESGSSSSAEEEDEEEGPVSEVSSAKATSSQEGSMEDVAKTPSTDPSVSDDHQQHCVAEDLPLPVTNHTPLVNSSKTTPSSTLEVEETG